MPTEAAITSSRDSALLCRLLRMLQDRVLLKFESFCL
jgi:hypothetical protein